MFDGFPFFWFVLFFSSNSSFLRCASLYWVIVGKIQFHAMRSVTKKCFHFILFSHITIYIVECLRCLGEFVNFKRCSCVCVWQSVIVCVRLYKFTFNQLHRQMHEWVSRHNAPTASWQLDIDNQYMPCSNINIQIMTTIFLFWLSF